MKEKFRFVVFAILAVVLTYSVLLVGCGKNPFTAVLSGSGVGGNVKVSIAKL